MSWNTHPKGVFYNNDYLRENIKRTLAYYGAYNKKFTFIQIRKVVANVILTFLNLYVVVSQKFT